MPEFVNPKYADASKTTFKSATRLECMMQDLPAMMSPDHKVSARPPPASQPFSHAAPLPVPAQHRRG